MVEGQEGGGCGATSEEALRRQILVLEQARVEAEAAAAQARESAARALEERAEMEAAWAGAAASLVEQACAPWAAHLDMGESRPDGAGLEARTDAEVQTEVEAGPVGVLGGNEVERAGAVARVASKRTGGRQACKARLRRQAAAHGTDVMDWMRVREHQRQLAEAVGGGDAWPAILEQRLEAARSRWASLQEASYDGGDAVRSYMRSTQIPALRFASEEAG